MTFKTISMLKSKYIKETNNTTNGGATATIATQQQWLITTAYNNDF
jgi:hypothetical protein